MDELATSPRVRRLAVLLIVIGVLLRAWQYAANTSFWLDEIAIARNVESRSLLRLIAEPLDFAQVAPAGFLALEKIAVSLFGASELAYRIFPFLASIAALFFFWRLAQRVLDGWAAVVALAMFAIGAPFIRYAAEAKQYGFDVLASIVLLLVAVRLLEREPTQRDCVLAGVAGVALVALSQAAVLVMAGIGAVLVIRAALTRTPATTRPALLTVPIWAAVSLAALLLADRSMTPATRQFMYAFWFEGFPPRPASVHGMAAWLLGRMEHVFAHPQMLRWQWPLLAVLLLPIGVAALGRRSRWLALVVLAPLGTALLAAAAGQFPFDRRLTLFVLPTMLLLVVAGADWLAGALAGARPAVRGALLALLLVLPVAASAKLPPPYVVDSPRSIYRWLAEHRRPGEPIYIFRPAGAGAGYYGKRFGLRRDEFMLGGCSRDSVRAFVADVDRLRGARRVWVVISRPTAYLPASRSVERYLATIGVRGEGITTATTSILPPASVYAWDLSDPRRLAAANAATFPVDSFVGTRPGCQGPSGTEIAM